MNIYRFVLKKKQQMIHIPFSVALRKITVFIWNTYNLLEGLTTKLARNLSQSPQEFFPMSTLLNKELLCNSSLAIHILGLSSLYETESITN